MKTLKFKFIAVAIASFVITANTVSAQAIHTSYTINAEEPFSVKYLGTEDNYLLFEVTVRSADLKPAALGISDKAEGELYAETFRTNLKVQKVKIEKRANQELEFKLSLGKAVYNKSFSANTSREENTTVSEKTTAL
jgi:hypothetical protein